MTTSILANEQLKELFDTGKLFLRTDPKNLEDTLLILARHLGKPMPGRRNSDLFTVLRPTERSEANRNSLSSRYGFGAFPFHTDTAHWKDPCRYICIACKSPGSGKRPTILKNMDAISLSESQIDLLSYALFLVRNGRNSFYTSILSTLGKERQWRFDPGCMLPQNSSGIAAADLMGDLIKLAPSEEFAWHRGDLLIIDNHRVLHARGSGGVDNRELIRVCIEEVRSHN